MSSPSAESVQARVGSTITPRRGGTALAVVGAVLLGIGIFTSTGASVQPVCPAGTKLVAKYEWTGTKYRFDQPRGNSDMVALSATSASGGKFSSKQPIAAIVVKGGPASKDTWITPAATTGSFSNAGLPASGGKTPNIDTVQFCVATAVNPAVAAGGFDVVTKGDAVLAANESEGPVAIGGNLRFDQYQVAIHSAGTYKVDPTDAKPTSLVVRGKTDIKSSKGQLTVDNGWVTIGIPSAVTAKRSNPNQIVVNAASAKPDAQPRILGQNSSQSIASATRKPGFDFDGAFTGWKTLAEGLSRCDATVKLAGANGPTAPWSGGDAYIYSTSQPGPSGPYNPSGQMVLKLTANDLSRLTSITFRSGAEPAANHPLVIVVSGVPANWNPPNINGDANGFAPYILWSFGGASKVQITGGNQLVGTALAPSATFDQEGAGNLVGAVYGGGEVHDRPFATTVTPCSCTPPTTTTASTTTSTVYPTSSSSTVYPTSSSTASTTSSTTSSTVYPTSSSTASTTSSTSSTTSSTVYPTSSSTASTSSSTTSSTVYPTSSSTAPTTSSTTSSSTSSTTSSTVYPTSSTAPTSSTSTTADVAGTTVVATSITPDDNTRVEGTTAAKGSGLAFTGSTSLPLVIVGALLLLAGVTAVLVDRRRSHAAATSHGDV